jgi:hypothetical protein
MKSPTSVRKVTLMIATVQLQFGVALPPGQARQLRQKLIDAMSHDAAVLKQKKHITPKSFTFFNVLELLSIIQVVLRRGSCATNI